MPLLLVPGGSSGGGSGDGDLALPIFFFSGGGEAPATTASASLTVKANLFLGISINPLVAEVTFTATARVTLHTQATLPVSVAINPVSRMTVLGAGAKFTARSLMRTTVVIVGREYRILVVNRTGWPYAELESARLDGVTWALNAPGTCDFVVGTEDPKALQVKKGREVQIWRGDQLVWWGPIVRLQSTPREVQVQCAGLLWYFERRSLGRADRENQLKNGSFEQGLANWSFANGVGHSIKKHTADLPQPLDGDRCLKLSGPAHQHEGYAWQSWRHRQSHPLGDLITVAVWCYVPSSSFTIPPTESQSYMANEGRGLHVLVHDATEMLPNGQRVINQTFEVDIDYTSPRDKWFQMEVEVLNVMADDEIEVRLYPPRFDAYYDLAVAVYMESLAFDDDPLSDITSYSIGIDQAEIVGAIILYAQDRPPFNFRHGKSDLYIDVSTPKTGVAYQKAYQFAEHQMVMDAISEYTIGDRGLDFDIEIGPTKRTFTTYYPYKGSNRDDLALEYGRNIAEYSVSWDGNQAATDVVVLGTGDGPDRPEGAARDTIPLEGLTLEKIASMPSWAAVGLEDDVAREELRISRDPTIIEVTTYEGAGALVGQLKTGDVVPVRIKHGSVDVDTFYRVVGLSLTPQNDTLNVTLNVTESGILGKFGISLEDALARTPNATDACLRPSGGVWVVASDGGVFSFGAAPFYGSMGGKALNAPMVAVVPHGDTGYWICSADAGIFAFGSAPAKSPYMPMVDEEYAAGDRAIIAMESNGASGVILIADDGSTYEYA